MGSGSLDKIQDDLNEVYDIDSQFNILESSVVNILFVVSTAFTNKVDTPECKNEGRHEQGVNGEHGDHKVPYLAESSLGIN